MIVFKSVSLYFRLLVLNLKLIMKNTKVGSVSENIDVSLFDFQANPSSKDF
jgi:hypothetical protein